MSTRFDNRAEEPAATSIGRDDGAKGRVARLRGVIVNGGTPPAQHRYGFHRILVANDHHAAIGRSGAAPAS